jgi:hypothetical protein
MEKQDHDKRLIIGNPAGSPIHFVARRQATHSGSAPPAS